MHFTSPHFTIWDIFLPPRPGDCQKCQNIMRASNDQTWFNPSKTLQKHWRADKGNYGITTLVEMLIWWKYIELNEILSWRNRPYVNIQSVHRVHLMLLLAWHLSDTSMFAAVSESTPLHNAALLLYWSSANMVYSCIWCKIHWYTQKHILESILIDMDMDEESIQVWHGKILAGIAIWTLYNLVHNNIHV